jgi:hypothetical protein
MAVEAIEAGKAKVNRDEWRWVLIWSAVILLATSLPYIYGALISTPQYQFGGLVIGVEDGNSYLAKMRLGATDGWQFHLFYTSEPHQGAYLFLFHLLLGKIARLSGLSFALVYHLARIVCGFFLLASVYKFAAFFSDLRPVRQLTFWLVSVGSGLGWLVVLLGLLDQLGLPLDFYSPEAFAFHSLLSLPHLALAEGLLLWALMLLLLAWECRKASYALLAGLALLGMTIIAAFYIVVAAVVIGVAWLLRWRQVRPGAARPWAAAGLAILAFAIAAAIPLYNAYVFTANPVLKTWAEQNRILSPSPVHYLLAFGLLALLAVVGVWTEWGLGLGHNLLSERRMLLVGWGAIVLPLVYIPFNLQRRLTLGVQVALSLWAALGLWRLLFSAKNETPEEGRVPAAKTSLRRWRVISVGVVALLSLSNLLILVGAGLEVERRSSPLFHTDAEISAADWLGAHATADQVVLAAYETGNYLPTRMPARVFAGHGPETVRSEEKIVMLRQFFAGSREESQSTPDSRRRLLRENGVTYVFYGPAERALGGFSPDDASYLRKVYDNRVVQIYQVEDAGDD